NFLTNALKYSHAPSPVEVVGSAEGEEVAVRVLDRGIGIDHDTAGHAFELFYRTKEASRVAAGAGIGLFVCRELIAAMGGVTWIAPREGGGTEGGVRPPARPSEDGGLD